MKSQLIQHRLFILIFLLSVSSFVGANFNLYLSHGEVKRILGLESELYYVREGVVNDYATGWTVKVPPTVHSINFQWQALSRRTVLYSMALLLNETAIKPPLPPLSPPSVNISLNGTVPRDASTFRLDLPCSGLVSAEVDVIVNINVTSFKSSQPPVILYLRRRKICLKGLTTEEFSQHLDSNNGTTRPILFYVMMGCLGLVLLLCVTASVFCLRMRSTKRRYSKSLTGKDQRNLLTAHDSIESKMGSLTAPGSIMTPDRPITVASSAYTIPSSFSVTSYASLYSVPTDTLNTIENKQNANTAQQPAPAIYEDSYYTIEIPPSQTNNTALQRTNPISTFKYSKGAEVLLGCEPSHLEEYLQRLEIPRQNVKLSAVLEEGTIGFLYRGFLQRVNTNVDQAVLVKTLRTPTDMENIASMCQEGTRLAQLHHANVVSLVGVSYADRSPPYLVYFGPAGKNLKKYLRQRMSPLAVSESTELFIQIAKAVEFLHSNNILHCDISARNCLISEDCHLRLTDAALTKDFFPEDYVSREGKPIRWLAPEVISDSTTTSASDVWSMGVLFWEIASRSAVPYSDITWWRLLPLLQSGRRLSQPSSCPDEIYSLMESCWYLIPSERPNSTNISHFLSAFHSNLNTFI